jgi:uncharacterized membrane protein
MVCVLLAGDKWRHLREEISVLRKTGGRVCFIFVLVVTIIFAAVVLVCNWIGRASHKILEGFLSTPFSFCPSVLSLVSTSDLASLIP